MNFLWVLISYQKRVYLFLLILLKAFYEKELADVYHEGGL